MFRETLSFLFLASFLQTAYAQIKTCYLVDGGFTADYPCNPEADVSSCCGAGWICGTNLFCQASGGAGTAVVGTCTDRNWANSNNPACPFPLNWGNTTTYYDHFNYKLNTTICSHGTICPNNFFSSSNDTCCNDHKGISEINYHNNAVLPTNAVDLSAYYASAGYTIPTDGIYKTATYSSYTTITPAALVPAAATNAPSTTPTLTSISTSTSTPTPTSIPPSGLSSGAKAGIGIGAAAGALAIAGIAVFFWIRRRRTLQRRSTDTHTAPQHNQYEGVPSKEEPSSMYGFFKGELPAEGNERTELDSEPKPTKQTMELDGEPKPTKQPHEMQG